MNDKLGSNLPKKQDTASANLQEANRTGQLAKDARVSSLGDNLVKNNARRPSSSSKSPISNLPVMNSNSAKLTNTLLNSNNDNQEARQRLERQKNLNNAAKIAEKVPVPMVQQAAKAAKAANIIQQSKQRQGGFLKNLLGGFGNNEHPSEAEQEAALAADAVGEEYEEGQTAGSVSIKLDRRTKMLLIGISCGTFLSLIFLCIILASAITDSAGESYLASKENPSEEELENQYQANENDESNSSNSEDSNENDNSDANSADDSESNNDDND